ncbi:MAG: porphobilinogen synthase [Devosiaceae bacterium]|nr:porphobilinogen synthase [Devosiaceae bacterium MH13]
MDKHAARLLVNAATAGRRMRRRRMHGWLRDLARENALTVHDLIWPIFLTAGVGKTEQIPSMPGVSRVSPDLAVDVAKRAADLGIRAVAVFPNTPSELRDPMGSEALNPNNLVCQAVRAIKAKDIDIGLITDVALDPYTSHGHDGVFSSNDRDIDNDASVAKLVLQAKVLAEAGADMVAPSDMMDGRIGAIRQYLDEHGHTDLPIMSYAAKYASAFYGPFRDAVGASATLIGDKRTYQMDPGNGQEAEMEVGLDIDEGADIVMVKPGMPYLDVLHRVKTTFGVPTTVYQVSGEFAMIEAAAGNGWIDRDRAIMESLLAFKRAGADGILTYFAPEIAAKLNG